MSRALILQELAARAGWVATRDIDAGQSSFSTTSYTLYRMLALGLVERRRAAKNSPVEWRITALGMDLLGGRAKLAPHRLSGARLPKHATAATVVATWLASLPRAGEVRM